MEHQPAARDRETRMHETDAVVGGVTEKLLRAECLFVERYRVLRLVVPDGEMGGYAGKLWCIRHFCLRKHERRGS